MIRTAVANLIAGWASLPDRLAAETVLGLHVVHGDTQAGRAPLLLEGFTPTGFFSASKRFGEVTGFTADLLPPDLGTPRQQWAVSEEAVPIAAGPPLPPAFRLSARPETDAPGGTGHWSGERLHDMKTCLEVMVGEEIDRTLIAPRGFYESTNPPRHHPVAVVYRIPLFSERRGETKNVLVLPPDPFVLADDHTFIRGVATADEFQRMRDMSPPSPTSPDEMMLSFLYHPAVGISVSNRLDHPHDCMRWGLGALNHSLKAEGHPSFRIGPRRLPKGLIGFHKDPQHPHTIVFTLFFDRRSFADFGTYLAALQEAARAFRDLGLPSNSLVIYSDEKRQSKRLELGEFLTIG